MTAKYIFRLDDATAFLNAEKWNKIEKIFDDFKILPIVAVTPDNKDLSLQYSEEDDNFWNRVQLWNNKGWDIAMHGYQHHYHDVDRKKSIIPYYDRSEFSGLTIDKQRMKIGRSFAIFDKNNIDPKIWVAPAHSFDETTLKALSIETNIKIISDGIALYPYKKYGFNFIPQQLWDVKIKLYGVWTICLHPDTMTFDQIDDLKKKLSNEIISRNIISAKEVSFKNNEYKFINFLYSISYWIKYRTINILRPVRDAISKMMKR